MMQFFNQLVQFLQQGISAIFRFVQMIWTWSVGQISQVVQSPWQGWPIWKQALLILIIAGGWPGPWTSSWPRGYRLLSRCLLRFDHG